MYAGYHAVFDSDYVEALRYAHAAGFDYVQFDLNVPRFFLDDRSEAELGSMRRVAEDLGVGISLHAPGDNISLFTDYPLIRAGVVDQFLLILGKAGVLGARHLTVHPGIYPSFRRADTERDDFTTEHERHYHEVFYDNLLAVVESAGDVMVCVENFGMSRIAVGVLERMFVEGAPVWLTWDLAKSYGEPSVVDFFRKHCDRIREVHVHDLLPGVRSHLPIGEGILDFADLLPLVRSPEVATTIEVRPREQARVTRDRLAALLQRF